MSRVVWLAAMLVAIGAAVVVVLPRFRAQTPPQASGVTATPTNRATQPNGKVPPTSEELIGAALAAGNLSYEESLLQRAYAIYGDSRVEPAFRSPVVDWEAGDRLFHEVDKNEQTLSAGLLEALAPFRVRPNDPTSIFSRPRDVLPAQLTTPADWVNYVVPGTDVRLWMLGSDLTPLEKTYGPMVSSVWQVFPKFFPHPTGDAAESIANLNPDIETDVYLVHGTTIDIRVAQCRQQNPPPDCTLKGRGHVGRAPEAPPRRANRSAGYVLADVDQDPDELLATIAHELAHVTQHNFDADEDVIGGIGEGSATWVEYKVLKELGKLPRMPYGYLDPAAYLSEAFFKTLDVPLTDGPNQYASWLFYQYAAIEFGNDIVTRIWQRAGAIGIDKFKAIDDVVSFEEHFPKFAVRNWNQDGVPRKYKSWDSTFPPELKPETINLMPTNPSRVELDEPVPNLAAQYYYYSAFDQPVRRITFENLYNGLPGAHVWALKKVGSTWQPPEDWTADETRVLCRDIPTENVSELVLVVSNSDIDKPLPPAHPKPRVRTEDVGCVTLEGWAKATLRVNKPGTNMTYVASLMTVQFRPRSVQNPDTGNTEYDLLPTSVVWTANGTEGDCRMTGSTVINFPMYVDQPLDPARLVFGYMNVVSADNGDFHSIMIHGIDQQSRMTRSCPGSPPRVRVGPYPSAQLLHILSQSNTHTGNAVSYKGQQTFDPERFQDNLPPAALEMLKGLPNASGLLNRRGGEVVYTFEWELKPRQSGP